MNEDLFWIMYWIAVGGMYVFWVKNIFFDDQNE